MLLLTSALLPLLLSLSFPLTSALPTLPLKRDTSVQIYSSRRPDKCLGTTFIRGPRPGIGVDLVDCSSGSTLLWDINRGAGQVAVSGNALVLDAGDNPGNFGFVYTETPMSGKGGQNWYYTGDNRIAITGGDQCLDDDGSKLQTYRCTTGNTNQIFYTRGSGSQPNPEPQPDPQPQPFNPYPDLPQGTVYADQSPSRRRIHPLNRGDLCLTVLGGSFRAGNDVAISYCVADSNPLVTYQLWNPQSTFARVPGQIPAADNGNYCLSSGQSNGAGTSLQPCSGGAVSFRWDNPTSTFRLAGEQYCLDVRSESRPGNESPLASQRRVQSWQCYEGNTNQKWTFLY